MIQVTPIIQSDFIGVRLWTLSLTGFPKLFLYLTADKTLFQQTMRRLVSLEAVQLVLQKAYRLKVQGVLA